MVFVGGVSASTTPIELVGELKKQGFNVTVLPRIRYGVSFGFCPDLVLSSVDEMERLLARERVWIKDRWVDIRPYIPKESEITPAPAIVVPGEPQECDEIERESSIEYINVEDLLSIRTQHRLEAQPTSTPPLGSPIHMGQHILGSPQYVPYLNCYSTSPLGHQLNPNVVPVFYPQHTPEFPLYVNSFPNSFDQSPPPTPLVKGSPSLDSFHPISLNSNLTRGVQQHQ